MGEDEKKAKKYRFGTRFNEQMAHIGKGGFSTFLLIFVAVILMALACLAVFFTSVRGEEQVMVPSVVGKSLTSALLEMQAKELYPKISLRYSDFPGEEGLVLEQEPAAGSIVKAYRRVTLTVSRGVAQDVLEEYVGQNIDAVQPRLLLLFSGTSLVRIAPLVYQKSTEPKGNILAQFPPKDTPLDEPVTVQFVVSSGSAQEMVSVPNLKGLTVQQVLSLMEKTKLVFDFTARSALPSEKDGTVVSASLEPQTSVAAYSHITVEFAFPVRNPGDDFIYGILNYTLPSYPYPVPVSLVSSDTAGNVTTLASFNHPGGTIHIPYDVRINSVLTLHVLENEVAHLSVQ